MGSIQSKGRRTTKTSSSTPQTPSSAAFGRLRFDSPGKSPLLLQRRLSERQRQRDHHHDASAASAVTATTTTTPTTGSLRSLQRVSSTSRIEKQQQQEREEQTATTEATFLLLQQKSHPIRLHEGGGGGLETKRMVAVVVATASSSPSAVAAAAVAATTAVPLTVWMGPALSCALCYALYNIFIKQGSSHISPILGGVILQFVAALFGTALLLYLLILTKQHSDVATTKSVINDPFISEEDHPSPPSLLLAWNYRGLLWAILAGVAVGAAEMISFFVSSLGVPACKSIPVIVGGSVFIGTILGCLCLAEQLTIVGWSGVVLISLGIALVGFDAPPDGGHQ